MDRIWRVAAHRVTHVVSLATVAITAVGVLAIASAPWGAYALVIAILAGSIVALVLFPQLGLEKQQLLVFLMAKVFGRFHPDLSQLPTDKVLSEAERSLEDRRRTEYEDNQGLFLGHYWRPSEEEGQIADIRIQLRDHLRPDGRPTPLQAGTVESVTYQLGPKFSREPITERDSEDNFALDVSAYGPMLCLAEVHFNDGAEDLLLSRYIDFPDDLQAAQPRPWRRRLLGS